MPHDEVKELTAKVDKILFYLYNDDKTDTKGLVQQVRDMRHDLDKVIVNQKISMAKRAVWNTVFGAIGGAALWLGKVLITTIWH